MWVERSRMVDGCDGCDGDDVPDDVDGFDGSDGVDGSDSYDGVDGSDTCGGRDGFEGCGGVFESVEPIGAVRDGQEDGAACFRGLGRSTKEHQSEWTGVDDVL